MKWYKHLTGSLKDPMIADLITEYGGDGYLIFFGILDMMAEDYDETNPGISTFSIKYLTRNLQVSRQKLVKVLAYIYDYPKNNGKILYSINGDNITLLCNRLKELTDNWTKRKLRSSSVVTTPQEGEGEGEGEGNLKDSCPEVDELPSAPEELCFITLPLNDKVEYPIYLSVISELKELFQAVDVHQEFRNMKGWLNADPKRRKTARGIKRFYTGWLSRAQDKYHPTSNPKNTMGVRYRDKDYYADKGIEYPDEPDKGEEQTND